MLHVARSNNIDANIEYRLVWCPYVTSTSDDHDVEYLFAVALGTSVSNI